MVPIGSVRWAQVAAGAPNHDAIPLSVLVTAEATAVTGGTTACTTLGSGVSGAVVVVAGAARGAATRTAVVVVRGGAAVVVGAGAGRFAVVVVTAALVVDVVGLVLRTRASSCSETAPATTAGAAGAAGALPAAGTTPAPASTRMAVASPPSAPRRPTNPATSVARHSGATYSARPFPLLGVRSLPRLSAAGCPGETLGKEFHRCKLNQTPVGRTTRRC
jgi:hypothetical protein